MFCFHVFNGQPQGICNRFHETCHIFFIIHLDIMRMLSVLFLLRGLKCVSQVEVVVHFQLSHLFTCFKTFLIL